MLEDNFLKGMAGIQIASGKNYDSDELDVLYGLLSDIDDKSYLKGCHNICNKEIQFFPGTNMVALIRRESQKISNPKLSPSEAWELVVAVSDNIGGQNSLSEPIKRAAKALNLEWHTIRPGGGFCLSPSEIGFLRREFMALYKDFSSGNEEISQNEVLSIEKAEAIS